MLSETIKIGYNKYHISVASCIFTFAMVEFNLDTTKL